MALLDFVLGQVQAGFHSSSSGGGGVVVVAEDDPRGREDLRPWLDGLWLWALAAGFVCAPERTEVHIPLGRPGSRPGTPPSVSAMAAELPLEHDVAHAVLLFDPRHGVHEALKALSVLLSVRVLPEEGAEVQQQLRVGHGAPPALEETQHRVLTELLRHRPALSGGKVPQASLSSAPKGEALT